jgi:tight adherence protein C
LAADTALLDIGCALAALAMLFATGALSAVRVAAIDELVPPLAAPLPSLPGSVAFVEARLARIGRTSLAHRFRHRVRLERCLQRAGGRMSLEAVIGLKLLVFLGVAALLLVAGVAAHSTAASIALCGPIGLAASRLPDLLVARKAHRRQLRIAAGVPDLAELLVATTGAGLNPPMAFRRSAEVLDGPLGDELRTAVGGLELGVPWVVVLEELAVRTEDPSLRRVIRAMGRSQRLGTPLTSALHNLAGELRNERQARAEELARRAPVKMLFPLVFLILPAFLLLTVGPVLLATLRSLH